MDFNKQKIRKMLNEIHETMDEWEEDGTLKNYQFDRDAWRDIVSVLTKDPDLQDILNGYY